MAGKRYTAQLAIGQGMIDETIALLNVWKPGMGNPKLAEKAIKEGVLARATAHRVKDIVTEVFANRYLVNSDCAAKNLQYLLSSSFPRDVMNQLFLIYTARANQILHDFITEVYWAKYSAGASEMTSQDALQFIKTAINNGYTTTRWSESTIKRVSSYLLGTLEDFHLVIGGKRSIKSISPFKISETATIYLAHDIHFSDYSDNGLIEHQDWKLFGLEGIDIVHELQRVSNGYFIPQYSGELMRISWNYKSMEEVLNAIAKTEF